MSKATKSFNIYAADDAPEIREILKHSLKKEDWVLSVFSSGEELVDACKTKIPDIIISDVKMPGISGHAVCSWAKQNLKSAFVPVILLTSLDTEKEKILGLKNGADDYITKPFSPEELKARVQVVLRSKNLSNRLKSVRSQLVEKEEIIALMKRGGDIKADILSPLDEMAKDIVSLRETLPLTDEQLVLIGKVETNCVKILNSLFSEED